MILPTASSSRFARLIRRAAEYDSRDRPPATIRAAFYHTFLRWLCLKIQEQCADIEELLGELPPGQRDEFLQWLRDGHYATLVPPWAMHSERELFLSDLRYAVELLEYAAA